MKKGPRAPPFSSDGKIESRLAYMYKLMLPDLVCFVFYRSLLRYLDPFLCAMSSYWQLCLLNKVLVGLLLLLLLLDGVLKMARRHCRFQCTELSS